mgnify:CR=1 FL=1
MFPPFCRKRWLPVKRSCAPDRLRTHDAAAAREPSEAEGPWPGAMDFARPVLPRPALVDAPSLTRRDVWQGRDGGQLEGLLVRAHLRWTDAHKASPELLARSDRPRCAPVPSILPGRCRTCRRGGWANGAGSGLGGASEGPRTPHACIGSGSPLFSAPRAQVADLLRRREALSADPGGEYQPPL